MSAGWIRPHGRLTITLMEESLDKKDDEFYGYALVTCPDCADTKAYDIGFRVGGKGWYRQEEPGWFPLDVAGFVKSFYWKSVNDIPLMPKEQRNQIFDRSLF